MELSDLEKIWQAEGQEDASVKINEKTLLKRNYRNASSEFEKLLNLSVLGRNLALVYFAISLILALLVRSNIGIAFAGLMGAISMLLSFFYHLSYTGKLKKLNYYSMPVIDLQKAISEFRIKSVGAGKYDLLVVLLWMVTLLPMVNYYFFNKNLYTYFEPSVLNALILIIVLVALFAGNKKIYKTMYEEKLLKAEAELKEILDFEV